MKILMLIFVLPLFVSLTTPIQAQESDGYETELLPWIYESADTLDGAQFDLYIYRRVYENAQPSDTVNLMASPEPSLPSDAALWDGYRQTFRQEFRTYVGVSDLQLSAPLNMTPIDRRVMTYETQGYAIEIFTFDALPGITRRVNLYYPLGVTSVPLVLVPMGCDERISDNTLTSDIIATSPQRLGANLALHGMGAVLMEGFCSNSGRGRLGGDHFGYQYYSLMIDEPTSILSLQLTAWLRLRTLIENWGMIDTNHTGCVGYSFGGYTCRMLALTGLDMDALVLVSSSFSTVNAVSELDAPPNIPLVDAFRRQAYQLFPPYNVPSAFFTTPLDTPNFRQQLGTLPRRLQGFAASELALSLPIPSFTIVGEDDPLLGSAEILRGRARNIDTIQAFYGDAQPPQLAIIPGTHNFDAARRQMAVDFLRQRLAASPLLADPVPLAEFSTEGLDASILMPAIDSTPLFQIFTRNAQTVIDSASPVPLNADTLRAHLHVHADHHLPLLMLDEQDFYTSNARPIHAQMIGVPIHDDLYASAYLMTVTDVPSAAFTEIVIYISDVTDNIIPDEQELSSVIDGDNFVIVFATLPGFGINGSSQVSTGTLALNLLRVDETLAGVGVDYLTILTNRVRRLYPGIPVRIIARQLDSGIVATFAAALDPSIDRVELRSALPDIETLLQSSGEPFVPPSLLIPGIALCCDLDDVRALVGPDTITIQSTSDLIELSAEW
jgi:pimeloyl-ACP methyl ester carboxylesterase